jgi:hypothetical protein
MTAGEQAELIEYARKFGITVATQYHQYWDDIVGASLHGAARAFASPDFPEDVEGRRKFVGQCCWNMMRRELSLWTERRQILFSEIATLYGFDQEKEGADIRQPDECEGEYYFLAEDEDEYQESVDWADEFEFLANHFKGVTHEVFVRAYGPSMMGQTEIAEELGLSVQWVHTHMRKIKAFVRRRQKRSEHV